MAPGATHTVELFWDEVWSLTGLVREPAGAARAQREPLRHRGWALDVVLAPDGSWSWKDEDDLAEALELGIFDAAQAAEIRAEGERVIAEHPWPTGWEQRRPPLEWAPAAA